jgi:hypothetical protein
MAVTGGADEIVVADVQLFPERLEEGDVRKKVSSPARR